MKRGWKTKSGQKLKIKDMSTEHIKNCISLLNRYHSAKLNSFYAFGNLLTGDEAQVTFDDVLEDLYENGWEDRAEDYICSFEKELERRAKNES